MLNGDKKLNFSSEWKPDMEIKRNKLDTICRHLDSEDILMIIGARQVGKTTLLKQIASVLTEKQAAYYSYTLEDPELLADFDEHPENLFQYVPKSKEKIFVLLDEVQYLNNPSNFLKYIYDQYKGVVKLIVTGSSAFYLDRKFKDSLAGRKRLFEMYPFSFSEFLLSKDRKKLAEKIRTQTFLMTHLKRELLKAERRELFGFWQEYAVFGGYPKVVLEADIEEKKEHLKELYISFLKKDIYEANLRNEAGFYKLIKILASQVGQLVNTEELAGTIGLSADTIAKYLYILQKSYIIRLCSPFYRNIRKELTKMPKIFFLDNGYRNALLNSFNIWSHRQDKGELLENTLYIDFTKANVDGIKFWRTKDKNEIDFVVNETYAFEAKVNKKQWKNGKYKGFKQRYPEILLKLVTENDLEELDVLDFSC